MKNLGQFKNRKGGKESASTRKQWKTRTKTKFVHESMRSYQRTKELESQPKGKHRDFLDYFRFTTLKPIFAFFLWKCSAYRASSGCVVVAAADAPWKRPDCFHTISMTTVHSNPFSMHGTTTTWYLYSSAQLRNVHDCLHPRKNLKDLKGDLLASPASTSISAGALLNSFIQRQQDSTISNDYTYLYIWLRGSLLTRSQWHWPSMYFIVFSRYLMIFKFVSLLSMHFHDFLLVFRCDAWFQRRSSRLRVELSTVQLWGLNSCRRGTMGTGLLKDDQTGGFPKHPKTATLPHQSA